MDPTVLGALIGGVLATIGGVLGGIVTGWFALRANQQSLAHEARRVERERSLAFRQEQLSQFYGPVLACMEELEESWQLLFEADKNVEKFLETHPAEGLLMDKQKAVLEYKQYLYAREVAVFNKIKEIFISHFGLAEPSTKENYRTVVRFIENRNIINVTERKLDITFTGEITSGLRDRIASLFQNLTEINSEIRSQLENGEPKPITQINPERSGSSLAESSVAQWLPPIPQQSFEPSAIATETEKSNVKPKENEIASGAGNTQGKRGRQNWPGRYTLLTNLASLGSLPTAPETSTKDGSSLSIAEADQPEIPHANAPVTNH